MNPNRRGSYIDSLDWIKNKKATINPVNRKDNKYFQYPLTVTLNYEEIEKDPEKTTKFKPFISKYKLGRNKLSIAKRRLEKVWENNAAIALNVF